jgi:hypothetical protein
MRDAFGRHGYVWEGLGEAGRGFVKLGLLLVVIGVGTLVARYAYTEYEITTQCTMILGTRVCGSQATQPAPAPAPAPAPVVQYTYSAQCASEYGATYAYQTTPGGHCVAQ